MARLVSFGGSSTGPSDVQGPASSTDEAIARFNGTTGKLLQDSSVLIDDSDNVSGIVNLTTTGTTSFNTVAYTWPGADGSANQFLQTNGGGTLSWSADIGFADWKTIGTGGDFSDVQAMIDGGETKGILLSNVTEDSDIAVPTAGLYLHLNDFILTLGANQFTFAGAFNLTIEGNSPELSEIDYTAISGGAHCINATTGGSVVRLSNFKFDNNSTVTASALCENTAVQVINNLFLEIENATDRNGIRVSAIGSMVNGIRVTGGGATCFDVIENTGQVSISNVALQGTFSTTLDTISNSGVLSNVTGTTGYVIELETAGAVLSNFDTSSGAVVIQVSGTNCNISNGFVNSGSITITADQTKISNCLITTLDMTNVGANFTELVNCEIGFAVTMGGGRNHFTNCSFNFGITVTVGAIDSGFMNCDILGAVSISARTKMIGCKVGANVGGGANTITVAAGTGSQIGLCTTDAAISDSGTSTQLVGNFVY